MQTHTLCKQANKQKTRQKKAHIAKTANKQANYHTPKQAKP